MAHPKGVLIERLQQRGQQPRFDTRSEGPDHEPVFESDVRVGDEVLGHGTGSTKRAAERRAAEVALERLDSDASKGEPEGNGERRRGRGGRRGRREAPPVEPDDTAEAGETDDTAVAGETDAVAVASAPNEDPPFEGPWPLFERVLAASLEVADHRVDGDLRGDDARDAVRAFALQLYKDVLEDLGEVVEEDEAEEQATA